LTTESKQVPALRRLRIPLLFLGAVAAICLWRLFRPELLFINQRVNEKASVAVATLQPVFTGSLHPLVGMQDTHGRVNVIDRGGKLQLEITNFGSKEGGSFVIALAPNVKSPRQANALGSVSTVGHEILQLPPSINLSVDKAVLLMKDNRLVATAILEPF
jgi:hypothetical protein